MESKQFKAATQLLAKLVDGKLALKDLPRQYAAFVMKHANGRQLDTLTNDFTLFTKSNKTGKVRLAASPAFTFGVEPQKPNLEMQAPPETQDPDAKVVNTTTAVLGPYGNEVAATTDARQFLHPQVFQYRSGIFPDPRNFQVEVKVTSAEAVKLENGTPLHPFGVELVMEISGTAERTDAWVARFNAQARLQMVG